MITVGAWNSAKLSATLATRQKEWCRPLIAPPLLSGESNSAAGAAAGRPRPLTLDKPHGSVEVMGRSISRDPSLRVLNAIVTGATRTRR